jgi:hypothetical protein
VTEGLGMQQDLALLRSQASGGQTAPRPDLPKGDWGMGQELLLLLSPLRPLEPLLESAPY